MPLKYKILIVDDDEINVEILEDILESQYELAVANNGELALQKMEKFLPDVVLLDIMMSGIDGYEVCRRIRANDKFRLVKVILVSAKAMVKERLKGYDVGADDYVTKPFDHNELMAKVNIIVKLKHEEEVDVLKTDLLHLLSHEKRTPLNTILGLSDLMLSTSVNLNTEQKYYLKEIYKAGQVLHAQTEKTLLLCQLKKNSALKLRKNSIEHVIDNALINREMKITDSKTKVVKKYSAPEQVMIEEELIQKAIEYLIDNSIEYSPEGSTVTITTKVDNNVYSIAIDDEGKGFPAENIYTLYNDFNETDVLHHTKGLGISIPLVNNIILHHKGTMNIKNRIQGGLEVTLNIPINGDE